MFLPYKYGHGGHFGHVTWAIYKAFVSLFHGSSTCCPCFANRFQRERALQIVDADGRLTPEDGYTISSSSAHVKLMLM